MKPKPCDHNALALVNCLLNQATTSCTNDFAFVRRPFALPTASITIHARMKESIQISVFRAQHSFLSLSCTNDFAFVRRRFAFADRLNHHLCRNERINSKFGISRAKQFFVVDKHHLTFLTLKTKQIYSNSTYSILEQRCHADICNVQQAHPISSHFFSVPHFS